MRKYLLLLLAGFIVILAACSLGGNLEALRPKKDERTTGKAFTVAFNANGGAPAPAQQTVGEGGKASEPAAMTKTGYTFGGWFKENTFANQWDFTRDTVTGNVNLYAKWNPINYTIAYDKNAAGAGGVMYNSSHAYDTSKALNANNYLLLGYAFAGWARTKGGAVEFADGQSVINLTAEPNATVTLYARWGGQSYIVAYDKNSDEATGNMTLSTFTFGVEQELKGNAFVRVGHTFAGWARTPTGMAEFPDRQLVTDLAVSTGETVRLYAKWAENTLTLTKNALTLTVGETETLVAVVSPSDALNKSVTWSSSTPGKASVDQTGKVTAIAAGTAVITATAVDGGKTAQCTVTVQRPETFTITFVQITDAAPFIMGPTIYRSASNGQTTATLTVDNPGQYSSIEWHIPSTSISGSGSSFTLNSANTAYNNIGSHFLTIEVIKGGIPYSRTITFTVAR